MQDGDEDKAQEGIFTDLDDKVVMPVLDRVAEWTGDTPDAYDNGGFDSRPVSANSTQDAEGRITITSPQVGVDYQFDDLTDIGVDINSRLVPVPGITGTVY